MRGDAPRSMHQHRVREEGVGGGPCRMHFGRERFAEAFLERPQQRDCNELVVPRLDAVAGVAAAKRAHGECDLLRAREHADCDADHGRQVAALLDEIVVEERAQPRVEAEELAVEELGRRVSHRQHGPPRPLHTLDTLGGHRQAGFANRMPRIPEGNAGVAHRSRHCCGASRQPRAPIKIGPMREPQAKAIQLKDYAPPAFRIETIELDVDIREDYALTRAKLQVRRNAPGPLVLDGDELQLVSVALDGKPWKHSVTADKLTIADVPDAFQLETLTRIVAQNNTKLEGLYATKHVFVTQCEPEGFRRITWSLDQPDVMARFTVTVHADKARYPVLLSNGNLRSEEHTSELQSHSFISYA